MVKSKKNNTKKYWSSMYEDISMPTESFGDCTRVRLCKNRNVYLANGLCVKCWDKKAAVMAFSKE